MVDKFSKAQTIPEAGSEGPCPKVVQDVADRALSSFWQQVYDTKSWNSAKKVASRKGVVIKSRSIPGSVAHQFRAEASFSGLRCQDLTAKSLFENRRSWDPTVDSPAYIHRYKGSEGDSHVDMCCYVTKPQAGGLIKGRCFVDVRITRHITVKSKDGSSDLQIVLTSLISAPDEALDEPARSWLKMAEKEGFVRATNLPGTGSLHLEVMGADGKRRVDCYQLNGTEIGGRLPPRIVNSATGDVVLGLFVSMADNIVGLQLLPTPPPEIPELPGEEAAALRSTIQAQEAGALVSRNNGDENGQQKASRGGDKAGVPFLFVFRLGSLMCLCTAPDYAVIDREHEFIEGPQPRS